MRFIQSQDNIYSNSLKCIHINNHKLAWQTNLEFPFAGLLLGSVYSGAAECESAHTGVPTASSSAKYL